MRIPTPRPLRAGFTLIELLVVIALILLLVGITVSISYSGLIDSHKTVGAGDRASGWLIIARSKAQREGAPRGVRFIINGTQIKEAQYLEVPDPYTARPDPAAPAIRPRVMVVHQAGSNPRVFVTDADFVDLTGNVFVNDVLSLPDSNTLHLITGFANATLSRPDGTTFAALEILVADPTKLPITGSQSAAGPTLIPGSSTVNFGFIRKARPMLGEPILQLTGDNAIDYNLCISQVDTNIIENTVDILFAPNGEVIGTTKGKTILWIRNTSFPSPAFGNRASFENAGQMTLVVIYTKTGAVATQPVTLPPNADPFAAAKDGFNTGL